MTVSFRFCYKVLCQTKKFRRICMTLCDSLPFIIISSIYTFIVGVFFISIIYGCCMIYVRCFNEKLSKEIKLLRIVFLVSSLFAIGCYPLWRWEPCVLRITFGNLLVNTLAPIWSLFYVIQCIASTNIYYITIVYVFKSTSFEISKRTQIIYKSGWIFAVFGSLSMVTLSIITGAGIYWRLIASFLLIIYIVNMIALTVLFIRKLVIVYEILTILT